VEIQGIVSVETCVEIQGIELSRPLRPLRPPLWFIASRRLTLTFLPSCLSLFGRPLVIGWRRRASRGDAHIPSSPPNSSTCFLLLSVCLAWRVVWQPSEPA